MKKRMLSAILAMSMVMGMGTVTAFAEDPSGDDLKVENDAFTTPNIDITVPTINSAGITLDPYNIANKGQIYSPEYQVINNSNVPVVFSIKEVTATGTVEGTDDALDIVAKKLTDGSKWASVSISITDGLGKTTTKVVPKDDTAVETEDIDIAATTYMAAYGGVATFKYTGFCADNVTKDGYKTWASTDTIAVNAKYSFAPVQCTPITVSKSVVSSVKELTVANGTDAADIDFPATVLGDGKEIPVVWVCEGYNASTAGNYTFTAKLADTDLDTVTEGTQSAAASGLYTISEKITMPTITVTVEAPASAG